MEQKYKDVRTNIQMLLGRHGVMVTEQLIDAIQEKYNSYFILGMETGDPLYKTNPIMIGDAIIESMKLGLINPEN